MILIAITINVSTMNFLVDNPVDIQYFNSNTGINNYSTINIYINSF